MELYWILRLPHLHNTCEFLSLITFFIVLFSCFLFVNVDDDKEKKLLALICKVTLFIFFLSGICVILVPTKTDLALMMGWDALQSDTVQEVVDILKDKIL